MRSAVAYFVLLFGLGELFSLLIYLLTAAARFRDRPAARHVARQFLVYRSVPHLAVFLTLAIMLPVGGVAYGAAAAAVAAVARLVDVVWGEWARARWEAEQEAHRQEAQEAAARNLALMLARPVARPGEEEAAAALGLIERVEPDPWLDLGGEGGAA